MDPIEVPVDQLIAEAEAEKAEKEIVSAIEEKFNSYRSLRQPFEQTWFINAAFDRGNHYVEYHSGTNMGRSRS